MRQRQHATHGTAHAASNSSKQPASKHATPQPARKAERKRRLTYKEKNELESLPDEIDKREKERDQIYASLADAAFLRDGAAVVQATARLDALGVEISEMMERWEALEIVARDS